MVFNSVDIYGAICDFHQNHELRTKYSKFREKYLQTTFIKQAFDTRRINQNTEFNPRRNLQYYQRSEPFINEVTAKQVGLFFKIKTATDELREQFIGEPDWLDSYTRVLANAVDQTLRIDQKDFDYSKSQLDYLSELLYVRYRIRPEDLEALSTEKLKNLILNKDERLVRRSIFVNYKQDLNKVSAPTAPVSSDNLVDKLFGNVKANKDNPSVKRSVNITITDSIDDKLEKTSSENEANDVKEG